MIAYDNIKMILGFYLLCPFMWLTVIKLSMSPLVPNKKALHPKAKGLFLSFRLLLTYIVIQQILCALSQKLFSSLLKTVLHNEGKTRHVLRQVLRNMHISFEGDHRYFASAVHNMDYHCTAFDIHIPLAHYRCLHLH